MVQQHAVSLHNTDGVVEVLTELEPLADKTAATLATSLEGVLRQVCSAIAKGISDQDRSCWLIHVLVGDGVASNALAARRLFAMTSAAPLCDGAVQYFLVVLKCASHQANLAAKTATVGAAARLGAGSDKAAIGAITNICGVVVRLYKFLLANYWEEFNNTTHAHIVRTFRCVPAAAAEPAAQHAARNLHELYTERVVPQELLKVMNNGLSNMDHVTDGETHGMEEKRIWAIDRLYDIVRRRVWQVDEHPVITRFWTFRDGIDRMLLMSLLDLAKPCLQLPSIRSRKANSKRLRHVQRYFADPASLAHLKRTSLSLQLTGIATGITGESNEHHADLEPNSVRLAKGAVESAVCGRLEMLLRNLWRDPALDAGAAMIQLLCTTSHLVIRFAQYRNYPMQLWQLVSRYNPKNYLVAAMDFLDVAAEELDVGLSLPLQQQARSAGDTTAAVAWLASESTQQTLATFFEATIASTLEVERRHAQAKRNEGSRLTHVASASRNHILRRYKRRQVLANEAKARALEMQRKAARLSTQSLAWERLPAARPQAAGCLRWGKTKPSHHPTELVRIGDAARMRQFRADHADALKAAVLAKRARADAAVRLARTALPTTTADWVEWLQENEDSFRKLLRSATNDRKFRSRRLERAPDMPAPVPRLQPQAKRRALVREWAHILQGRNGWFCLKSIGGWGRGGPFVHRVCRRGGLAFAA